MTARLSQSDARRIFIASQGIDPARRKATKAELLPAIQRMLALQIDTISVVARSPYFVLWSRLGNYDPAWLDELLSEGAVFEYWAHAACFLPAEDFPLYRRRILDGDRRWARQADEWLDANRQLADTLLLRIRDDGPVRSSDFERPDGERGNGWWSWKAEKLALEMLFASGTLMIARRERFQRVYDLTERVRPGWEDWQAPAAEETYRLLVTRTIRALGVARPEWVANYLQLPAGSTRQRLREMVASGELLAVDVDGWESGGLVLPDALDALGAAPSFPAPHTTLLSPFDPVVWDRRRALEMFGFDYRIECYTPASKRKYGYFTLPILHGDALAGRLDAKAHRKDGLFEVKSLHLEPGFAVTGEFVDGLRDVLKRCAAWHRTPEVVVREANRPGLALMLDR